VTDVTVTTFLHAWKDGNLEPSALVHEASAESRLPPDCPRAGAGFPGRSRITGVAGRASLAYARKLNMRFGVILLLPESHSLQQ
jgi:hypothetical protein